MILRYLRLSIFSLLIFSLIQPVSHAAELLYTADALPSVSGWEIFESISNENGNQITSSIINDSGSVSWRLEDSSGTYRCRERYTELGDISFNTGATLAARVKCVASVNGSYNLGISNGNVGGMYLAINTNSIQLIERNGTVRGTCFGDGTDYHTYYLTVQNNTQNYDSTAIWRVYRDGTQVLSLLGAGDDDDYDGFVVGHAGAGGTGTWCIDWVAASNDGAFAPGQWDPFAPPAAPAVISPAGNAVITTPAAAIQWTGDTHTTYEVHINTTNVPGDANVWDSGEVSDTGDACTTGSLPNGTYYVFVRLGKSVGWGPWSATGRRFTVNAPSAAPGAPSIIVPGIGTTARSSKPMIQWNGDPHNQFEVHINSTNVPGDANVWDSGVVTSTNDSYDLGPLANGSYYAFVRLRNSFSWGPWSAAGHGFTVDASGVKLKKGWVLQRPYLDDALALLSHMREYHINHVELSHNLMMYVWQPINNPGMRNTINQLIDAAHANGTPEDPVEVVLWTHESDTMDVPQEYLIGGTILNYDAPGYWDWLADRYRTLFDDHICPGADGLVLTFSENDYGVDPWNRTETKHTGQTPEQTMTKIIETIWGVCQEYTPAKSLYVRNWTDAGKDRWVRNAVLNNDPRIWLMSKATGAGDWWVIKDDYDIIGTATGHPEMVEFDIVGEYWGLAKSPWAGIEYFRHLWSDFSLPRGADGMVSRVDRGDGKAIDSVLRINMYALDALADYPDLRVDDIYNYWSSHWFGPAAAAKVTSSLKRSFDITNAIFGMPTPMWNSGSREAFSTSVARDYCLQSLFDVDCVSAALKSKNNFMSDGQTNYQILRNPLMYAAGRLSLSVPSTLFGDFSPVYSDLTSPPCEVTLVDAQLGLNPSSFKVEFSRDGGSTWTIPSSFTVTSGGSSTEPYKIAVNSIPFNNLTAALNKVRFTATNLAGTTVTSRTYTVRGRGWADISLGTMASDGITHPQGSDGDTVFVSAGSAGGRSCRKLASSSETSFYFTVDDGFAYDRSPDTLYLQVDYYGSSGFIMPIYDSTETYEQSLPPVYLHGSNKWRTVVWRLDKVNFGNRHSASGADFRLYVGGNTGVYISRVRVHYTPPAGTLVQPLNLHLTARSTTEIELRWDAVPGATGYQVYRDEICIGSPGGTSFVDTGRQPNTQYVYRVIACGALDFTSCASDYRYTTTPSVPPSPSTVTCNRPVATWQPESDFTFTAAGGFGPGKVAYYRYVWDESPTHIWTGNEPSWPSVDPPSDSGWSVWRPTVSPTADNSGWLLYEGSTTMRGTLEAMVAENGTPAWMFADQTNFFFTKVKLAAWPNVPISRDLGATLVVRMKAADSPRGWTNNSWNFGFNLLDCQEMGALVQPGFVKIVGPSGSSNGVALDNGYSYHTYTLTLKNKDTGINSSTIFKLYRDGELKDYMTYGSDPDHAGQWSGPILGQPSSSAMGAWYYQWVAWRNDGASAPMSPNSSLSMTGPSDGSSSLYLHLQGYNADGVANGTLDLGPYYYQDGSKPVPPKVTDDGRYTTRDALHFSWSPAAPAIDLYEVAVGSAPGGQDVLPFTPAGSATELTKTGLSMLEGQTYYITVRGIASGNVGTGGKSDGITVAPDKAYAGAAKLLADGAPAALYNQTVTAVFGDCAYVQEPYCAGIRVVTDRPMNLGDKVDLAGVMDGAGGERVLLADTAVASGTASVKPVAMTNRALGGSPVPPYVPAFDPVSYGPSNLSMLVRTCGTVRSVDPATSSFTLDDGSGAPVVCQMPVGSVLPHDGRFACVTGIVSCKKSGANLERVLLVRRQEDVSEL